MNARAVLSAGPGVCLSPADRVALGALIEAALAILDADDGDPDLEPNGDERDANGAEDDFMRHEADGPGCPASDPGGGAVDDEPQDEPFQDLEPDERFKPIFGVNQTRRERGWCIDVKRNRRRSL